MNSEDYAMAALKTLDDRLRLLKDVGRDGHDDIKNEVAFVRVALNDAVAMRKENDKLSEEIVTGHDRNVKIEKQYLDEKEQRVEIFESNLKLQDQVRALRDQLKSKDKVI